MTTLRRPTAPRASFRVAVPLCAILAAAFVAIVGLGGESIRVSVSQMGVAVAAFFAVGAAAYTARRAGGRERRAWWLVAVTCMLWGLGESVWAIELLARNVEPPIPSIADVFYLSGIGTGAMAMLALPALPRLRAARVRAVWDGMVLAASALLVAWVGLLRSLVTGGDALLTMIVNLAYPVGDVVIISIVVTAALRARRDGRRPLFLLTAGMAGMVATDTVFMYLDAHDLYSPGLVDAGWFIAYLFIALAAIARSDAPDASAAYRERQNIGGTLVPTGAAIASIVVWAIAEVRGANDTFVFWNGLLILTLVVGRLILTLLDHRRELTRRALHDSLTGLPNRALLREHLARAIERADRTGDAVALIALDVDRFETISEIDGFGTGDQVVEEVARRLAAAAGPGQVVARTGGHEFTILIDVHDRGGDLIAPYLAVAEKEVDAGGRTHAIGITCGIVVREPRGDDCDDTMRNALLAHSTAKVRAVPVVVYEPGMHLAALDRAALESDLAGAVERGEMVVVYQPIVEMESERVVAVEALVRWHHPLRGLVSPAEFIPIAEESGAVIGIGSFVRAQAMAQAAAWNRRGGPPVRMSINLSPRELEEPSIVDDVARAVWESGVTPSTVTLEITESAIMRSFDENVACMAALKVLGVRLAIDDFGTGYSSLSYLSRIPADVLKIDRSFVAGVCENTEESAIARAIVSLSQALEMQTVAEGIETPEQAEALRALGTTFGQGFLYGAPMPPRRIEELLGIDDDTMKLDGARR